MHTYHQRDIFIYLMIFALLILGCGVYYREWLGSEIRESDPLFFEMSGVYKKTYVQTANVSSGVDMRMIAPVRNPCKAPYDIVCSAWVKDGSYLISNALAIHNRRVERAVKHSTMRHPWVSALWNQCTLQLLEPLDDISIQFIKKTIYDCEPPSNISMVEQNLHRIACFEQQGLFPLLDWRHNRVQLSPWTVENWGSQMITDSCEVLSILTEEDSNNCAKGVTANLNILKHAVSTANEKKILLSEWNTLVRNRIVLPGNLTTQITLWNREMFSFLLTAMENANFRYLLQTAVISDLLQYTGHPHYFTMYSMVTSLELASDERAFPPSIYGWGPAGYSQIMLSKEREMRDEGDETMHPDILNVCLSAIGDIYPQGIDQLIYPKQHVIERANAIVQSIRAAFVAAVSESTVLTSRFKNTAVEILETMEIHIGNQAQEKITERGATFAESVLISRRLNRRIEHLDMPGNFHFDTFNAIYDPVRNHIFLPVSMVLQPYFSANDTIELQYGRFGVLVAHEIAHMFNRFVLQAAGKMPGEDFRIFSNSMNCFFAAYRGFDEQETLPDVLGFEMALQACQRAKGCLQAKEKMMFFSVYGQTMCSNRQHVASDPHRRPEFRVNTASLLARNLDGTGFAANLWYCSEPYSCAFWK